jgi:hypothetical protein
MIARRSFITGLMSLVAAPAIVRAGSLMPVKVVEPKWMIDPDWLYGPGPMMAALPWLSYEMVSQRYGSQYKIGDRILYLGHQMSVVAT